MAGRKRLLRRRVLDGLLPHLDCISTDSSDNSDCENMEKRPRKQDETSSESESEYSCTDDSEPCEDDDYWDASFDFQENDANFDESDSRQNDYRFIAYVNFASTEGLSMGCLRRLDWLMVTLYGQQPPFTSHDVQKELLRVENAVVMEKTYYCNQCGLQKSTKSAACNVCRGFQLMNTTTFVVLDATMQLQDLLAKKGSVIVEAHRQLHMKDLSSFPRHDFRRSEGYMDMLETKQEFEQNVVHLVVSLSSDGARYKRISKREVTPVLMRVECLPSEDRTGGGCFIVLSMAYSDGGVKKHSTDEFIQRSLGQLRTLGLEVAIDGESWNFQVVIVGFLSDMKEQRSLTGLPNWSQTQGCAKCTTIGLQKAHGITYCDTNTFPLRTDDDYFRWSAAGTHGFSERGIPIVFTYISPTKFLIDPFHIKAMGVSKTILNELVHPAKWKAAKMLPGKMDLLTEAIKSTKNYTYDTVPLGCLGRTGKATGREVEKLALITAGMSSYTLSFYSREFNIFMLAMYNALFFTGSTLSNSRCLRNLLDALYKLHVHLSPESVTIKFHNFYKHLQEHEGKYGFLLTTEAYEREHKQFMVMINQFTSNCENILATRYIIAQMCGRKLDEMEPQLSIRFREAVQKSRKRRMHGCGQSVGNTDFGPSNFLRWSQLTEEHKQLLYRMRVPQDVICRKRIYVTSTIGSFVFCASDYWNVRNTKQSLICWTNRHSDYSFRFGEIQVIFDSDGSDQCVAQLNLAISLENREKQKPIGGSAVAFNKLTGVPFNVKSTFRYPSEPPFSGEVIDIEHLPRLDKQNHIQLRKNLFIIVGRSCKNQPDVCRSWLLPGDRYCRGTFSRFPQSFYDSLKSLFSEFFNIEHRELDAPYQDSFANLEFLQLFEDPSCKRKYFKMLSAGRQQYLQATFHHELKEALLELKKASFTPAEPGSKFGEFHYRKRNNAKEDDEEE